MSLNILSLNLNFTDILYIINHNIIFDEDDIKYILSTIPNFTILNNYFFDYLKDKYNMEKSFIINYIINNNINIYNYDKLIYFINFYKIIINKKIYEKNLFLALENKNNITKINIYKNLLKEMNFTDFIKLANNYNLDISFIIYDSKIIKYLTINEILFFIKIYNIYNEDILNIVFKEKYSDFKYIYDNDFNKDVLLSIYKLININKFILKYTRNYPLNIIYIFMFFKVLFDEKLELKFLKKLKNNLYFTHPIINYIIEYYDFKYENNKNYVMGLKTLISLQDIGEKQ